MFDRILVVCTANICRSPVAEVLLKEILPNHTVESAGTMVSASKLTNASAHHYSLQVCAEHGFDLSCHAARQLSPELCAQFDLILVMSHDHIEEVAQLSPGSRSKTMLLGQWIGQGDIDDPVHQPKEAFDSLFRTLVRATDAWVQKLT
ncbi:low molecular weight phosphotyrosine protein phosphatase [Enterovibrio sp. ZSDZ35]|uniref:protein-tyrosine-phosphatase n=1 Tax=Enterovibrio qingdaonensis TaxID=2899818 RepID=A0ABT5QPG4_9GAMM|nr:low molecular weight protein-tyrosine-phosphatase [Enterovibrio sp. ZSDZ35]MDD1782385.1 low molecular weight phosphotyrosine protein phosphatase [Enterovibrio sp. ZSDZ35]